MTLRARSQVSNLMASLVLFLIAIPLNLGIALASGVGATAGLLSGIVGAIVVGGLAGCPLMVSGPATGLIAVVWQITDKHGLEALGAITLAAGFLQVLLGLFRLAPWFRAVAPAVIQGMLAGIGILIFASQFHVMLEQTPYKTGLANLLAIPKVIYLGLIAGDHSHLAGLLGVLTITFTALWGRIPGRAKLIPGSLVGVGAAIIIARIGNMAVRYVQVPTDMSSDLHPFYRADIAPLISIGALTSVMALAFVATAQTLLTATAVDRLHAGEPTNYDREALAQGCGNVVAGSLGILPVCGVIVRSAANVQAGSFSRLSNVLHGVWVALFVGFFSSQLEAIPISSLAAVLVYTGCRLVNLDAIRELARVGRGELVNYWVTLLGVVATDLLTGIALGFAFSAARLIYVLSHFQLTTRSESPTVKVIEIQGSATFFTLPALARSLRELPPGQEVHLFLSRLNYIDHACLEHLTGWEEDYIKKGGQVYVEWDHLMERFRTPLSRELGETDSMLAIARGQLPVPDETYEKLVLRSEVVDLVEGIAYQDLVESVLAVLGDRLREEVAPQLRRGLLHEIAEAGPPRLGQALVPCHRVGGLERMEMVLVRCREGVRIPNQTEPCRCLVFLLSPPGRAGEYLRHLAALSARLEESEPGAWDAATGADGLRQVLLAQRRVIRLEISQRLATAGLAGRSVQEVAQELPTSCLVAMIVRGQRVIVPRGSTRLLEADFITVLGDDEGIEQLRERYVLASPVED